MDDDEWDDDTRCRDTNGWTYVEHDDTGSNPYECRRCGAELTD